MTEYPINIFYSVEDGGFIADLPDLSTCSAFGETPAEALVAVEQARDAWLAAARENGKLIPAPRYRSAVDPVG